MVAALPNDEDKKNINEMLEAEKPIISEFEKMGRGSQRRKKVNLNIQEGVKSHVTPLDQIRIQKVKGRRMKRTKEIVNTIEPLIIQVEQTVAGMKIVTDQLIANGKLSKEDKVKIKNIVTEEKEQLKRTKDLVEQKSNELNMGRSVGAGSVKGEIIVQVKIR